jgi:hypothetical protein
MTGIMDILPYELKLHILLSIDKLNDLKNFTSSCKKLHEIFLQERDRILVNVYESKGTDYAFIWSLRLRYILEIQRYNSSHTTRGCMLSENAINGYLDGFQYIVESVFVPFNLDNSLRLSIINGHLNIIEYILCQTDYVEYHGKYKFYNVLELAIENGNSAIVKFLVNFDINYSCKYDIGDHDFDDWDNFHKSMEKCDTDMIKYYIQRTTYDHVFHYCIENGHRESAEYIVQEEGMELDIDSAIVICNKAGYLDIMYDMIQISINIYPGGSILTCIQYDCLDHVKQLVEEFGVQCTLISLLWAVMFNYVEIVMYLVDHGASINDYIIHASRECNDKRITEYIASKAIA